MEFNTSNTRRFLGDEATDRDCEQYAAFLLAKGWNLVETIGGELAAERCGERMTEEQWTETLREFTAGVTVNVAELTEEQRVAFIGGWSDAGGYTGDVGTPCPWCAPWTYTQTIKVRGTTPEEWGAHWWDLMADEVEAELGNETEEED